MITRNLLDAKRNLRAEEVIRTLGDLQGAITEISKRMDSLPQSGNGGSGGLTAQQRRDVAGLIGALAQPLIGSTTNDPILASVPTGNGTVSSVTASSGASGFGLAASPSPIIGTGNIAFSITSAATARATLGIPKNKIGPGAPGINDDVTKGYDYLSLWVNTSTGDIYGCADPSSGAASWLKLSP